MKEAEKLLQNLVYRSGYLKATIKEGVIALKPYTKALEAIHIIGLPGAGKTTLSQRLSKVLKVPVIRIGYYRVRFPLTSAGVYRRALKEIDYA